jgi:Raf kinase inhibitor-like YbhB/YbcL family protein
MRRVVPVVIAVLVLGACSSGEQPTPDVRETIEVSSPVLEEGGRVPTRFTCDGEDLSPPLAWAGIPENVAELALTVADPDAPGGTFVHWAVYGIDPSIDHVEPGSGPPDAREGENDFGETGYGGPCPPEGGAAHRYVFTVWALTGSLELEEGATGDAVFAAIEKTASAKGALTARYER